MRKNKYRAYQKNAKWMLPVLSINWGADGEIESITVDNTNNNTRNVSPRSQTFYKNDPIYSLDVLILMEFTGLTDKNGKEIYERDVVLFTWFSYGEYELETEYQGSIDFLNGSFLFCCEHGNYPLSELEFDSESDIEVIGNIHDNPELLT